MEAGGGGGLSLQKKKKGADLFLAMLKWRGDKKF